MVSQTAGYCCCQEVFSTAIREHGCLRKVTTDLAAPPRVIGDLLPYAVHDTTEHANNRVECDHGRLKARLRPMRSLKTDKTATAVIRCHAFIQNLRRGHYELGVQARYRLLGIAAEIDELAQTI